MATLTGKITDVTGRAPDFISSITVKVPSVRVGGGADVIVSSPATVDFNRATGDITISGLTGGLSWLYLEGEGWSDSIALAVAEGMITLVEAIANALGTPGIADYIRLLADLEGRIEDIAQGAVDAAGLGALELLAQEVAEASTALDDKARFLHRTVQAESISRLEAVQEVPSSPDPTTLYLVLAPIGTVELKESDWSSTYRVKVALEEGQEAPYYDGQVLSESFIGAPNGWHTWGEQELAVPKDGRYKIRTTATPATGWVTISTYDQAAADTGVFNWAFGSVVELVADLKAGDLVYAYATSYDFIGETTITTNISETTDPLTDISGNDDPKALATMRYRLSGTMGAAAEMPSAEAPMIGEFASGSSNWVVDGREHHGLTPLHSAERMQWEITVESSKNVGAVGFYIYDGATKKFRETESVLGQTYTSTVALNNSDVLYPILDTGGTLTGDIQLTVTAKAVI